MLERIALATVAVTASLLAPACSKPPESPAERLLGTWEMEMPAMPKSMARELLKKDPNTDPQEIWAKVADQLRRDEGNRPMRITYRADGSALMEGGLMGHPVSDVHSWEFVSSTANDITIHSWTATRPEKERQTFTFETPNKLTYADGLNRGMGLIRVE